MEPLRKNPKEIATLDVKCPSCGKPQIVTLFERNVVEKGYNIISSNQACGNCGVLLTIEYNILSKVALLKRFERI